MLNHLAVPNVFSSTLPPLDGQEAASLLRASLSSWPDLVPSDDWLGFFAAAYSRRDVFALRFLALSPDDSVRQVLRREPELARISYDTPCATWSALLRWAGLESEPEIRAGLEQAVALFCAAQDLFEEVGYQGLDRLSRFIEEGPADLRRNGGRWELVKIGSGESTRVSLGYAPSVQVADALVALQGRRRAVPALMGSALQFDGFFL